MDQAELNNRFEYHPPTGMDIVLAHKAVRVNAAQMAAVLNDVLPEGREKSLAMTKLEEVMFWSNAAIARNQ